MMGKDKHKISSWKQYNQVLVNWGSALNSLFVITLLKLVKCCKM
ncbi:hypothetical protein [Candidatus Enterovibrio escicola]|nr:hypothetical protein [Candidatus Enterovibrio escacola]